MTPTIIDVAFDVTDQIPNLLSHGVKTVIRYYNHTNSSHLPSKCLTKSEFRALARADLDLAVVFQQGGGHNGMIDELSHTAGDRDAKRAVSLAEQIGQPHGSAIYFAVDHDYYTHSELKRITPYFERARNILGSKYRLGVYGSGTICSHIHNSGLSELSWIAGATGWSGTKEVLQTNRWHLFQKYMDQLYPYKFPHDGNIHNPAYEDFGQFSNTSRSVTDISKIRYALYEVIARPDLNLRGGPGQNYRIIDSVKSGTVVAVWGKSGDWLKVDLERDGMLDGYMHGSFMAPLSGGLPIYVDAEPQPIDIAWAELALNVQEIQGKKNNPRVILYHQSTAGGSAPDETAWCSSFVNYCVEQSGRQGTDSKWARSWHDERWGQDVTDSPMVGDIVVFRRRRGRTVDGGHVGFFLSEDKESIQILGGNQGDRVSVSRYPRNGQKDMYTYTLLSIRRG